MTELGSSPTADEALHLTVDRPFEDVVDEVQLEHELGGFETVEVTRLDEMVKGVFGEDVERTALIVVCHAEIARKALSIDQELAGLLPCTTVVYEDTSGSVHVHHVSATKAIRDLGAAPDDAAEDVAELVDITGERMTRVWENVREHVGAEA